MKTHNNLFRQVQLVDVMGDVPTLTDELIKFTSSVGSTEGKQAVICGLKGDPLHVVKVFHGNAQENEQRISTMLRHALLPEAYPHTPNNFIRVAWPQKMVYAVDDGTFLGYTMIKVENGVPLSRLLNQTGREQICKTQPGFSFNPLEAAMRLAQLVTALHSRGITIGDFNPANFLFTAGMQLTAVDCDSYQYDANACQYWYPETASPQVLEAEMRRLGLKVHPPRTDQERLSSTDDDFGLALLTYRLLMDGKHPFEQITSAVPEAELEQLRRYNEFYTQIDSEEPLDEQIPLATLILSGYWTFSEKRRLSGALPPLVAGPQGITPLRFDQMPERLRPLFLRCFDEGHDNPRRRPPAQDWFNALNEERNARILRPGVAPSTPLSQQSPTPSGKTSTHTNTKDMTTMRILKLGEGQHHRVRPASDTWSMVGAVAFVAAILGVGSLGTNALRVGGLTRIPSPSATSTATPPVPVLLPLPTTTILEKGTRFTLWMRDGKSDYYGDIRVEMMQRRANGAFGIEGRLRWLDSAKIARKEYRISGVANGEGIYFRETKTIRGPETHKCEYTFTRWKVRGNIVGLDGYWTNPTASTGGGVQLEAMVRKQTKPAQRLAKK